MFRSISLEALSTEYNKGKRNKTNREVKEKTLAYLNDMNNRNNFPGLINLNVYYCDGIDKDYNVGNKERMYVFINTQREDYIGSKISKVDENLGNILSPSASEDSIKIEIDGDILAEYFYKEDGSINALYIYYDAITYDEELLTFENILIELFKEKEKANSYKNEKVRDRLMDMMTASIEREYRNNTANARANIENAMRSIEARRRDIVALNAQIEQSNIILHGNNKKVDEIKDKIIKDFDLIYNHKDVDDLFIKEDELIVKTEHINFFDKNGIEYVGGKYEISINMNNNDIRFSSSNPRNAGWSSNDPHPHVSNQNGQACFGNVSSTLADLFSQKEYYPLVVVLINFLKSVDIDDSVGKYAYKWDTIVDGVVTPSGEGDELCPICSISMGRDEGYSVYEIEYDSDDDEDEGELGNEVIVCEECYENNTHYSDYHDERVLD